MWLFVWKFEERQRFLLAHCSSTVGTISRLLVCFSAFPGAHSFAFILCLCHPQNTTQAAMGGLWRTDRRARNTCILQSTKMPSITDFPHLPSWWQLPKLFLELSGFTDTGTREQRTDEIVEWKRPPLQFLLPLDMKMWKAGQTETEDLSLTASAFVFFSVVLKAGCWSCLGSH